ncbi:PREDICTED: uncharacterized protein LOC101290729 [Fragaria vesca subsp. vesca]|uniref:uncharacterized protein LOC101290729 n=1 Tax=Fragaria vesca subsp. vesca TaxID=101020 RepID=UPI0002C343B3|nr:PREDICTED: uncharacterized protein LOC101290729 [Fragaria vesca subsp. vesca]
MKTAPMLLIHGGKKDKNNTGRKDTWNLYNIMNSKVLDLQVSVSNLRYCGSSKGWLIALDHFNIVRLINPFFRVRGRKKKENSIIYLPPLDIIRRLGGNAWGNYQVYKAIISADPILNADDCIVMVMYRPAFRLAFINLSKDMRWTYVDESAITCQRRNYNQEVAQLEDGFYAVKTSNQLLSIDTHAQYPSNVKLKKEDFEDYGELIWNEKELKKYLVDLNEQGLLLVQRYITYTDDEYDQTLNRETEGFTVFEFNFDECQWIEKNSIGDLALFLGDNSSVSVVASNFPGCRSNCIYFNHDADRRWVIAGRSWRPDDFGVYDIGTRCFSKPNTNAMTLIKTTRQPLIWIHPTIFL